MTRRVMVDIETMSTDNANALILSVGAAEWTWNKKETIIIKSGLWVLDPREQLALGRGTSQNTLDFWQRQSDAAKEHWLCAPSVLTAAEMAQELGQLVKLRDGSDFDCEVWANGIVFDLGNLTTLYRQANLGDVPWKYNKAMDARTIYKQTAQIRNRPSWRGDADNGGPAHNPVADCRNQIWGLWEHWPEDELPNTPENAQ